MVSPLSTIRVSVNLQGLWRPGVSSYLLLYTGDYLCGLQDGVQGCCVTGTSCLRCNVTLRPNFDLIGVEEAHVPSRYL